ncbi:branched-chain amino acid ABC transporter permease [[Eubacterium] cellulosolvens]
MDRLKKYQTLLLFLFFTLILPFFSISVAQATDILLFGLFAISFNILLGFTGILSFGHGLFFGLGAYGTGLFLKYVSVSPLSIAVGTTLATIVAAIVAYFCTIRRGVYFAMITIAFNQLFYFIFFTWRDFTGGDDGLVGIRRFIIELPFLPTITLQDPLVRYYFFFMIVGISIFLIKRILESPFGLILQAVRENEERTMCLGYNVNSFRFASFLLSGLFSGIAGSLYCIHLRFVGVTVLHWMFSGEVIMMTILGGMHIFFGPFIGAVLFVFLRDLLSNFTMHWPLIIGVLFIILTLWLRRGVLGRLASYLELRGT